MYFFLCHQAVLAARQQALAAQNSAPGYFADSALFPDSHPSQFVLSVPKSPRRLLWHWPNLDPGLDSFFSSADQQNGE